MTAQQQWILQVNSAFFPNGMETKTSNIMRQKQHILMLQFVGYHTKNSALFLRFQSVKKHPYIKNNDVGNPVSQPSSRRLSFSFKINKISDIWSQHLKPTVDNVILTCSHYDQQVSERWKSCTSPDVLVWWVWWVWWVCAVCAVVQASSDRLYALGFGPRWNHRTHSLVWWGRFLLTWIIWIVNLTLIQHSSASSVSCGGLWVDCSAPPLWLLTS